MAKRKALSKGLRFEIFKRDHFTCQYCGAQPPKVVLVIDHIVPVASGGDNDISNLLAACEACNLGKTDKSLTARQVRPDADLLYLETQQEIAELQRYNQAKKAKEAAIREVLDTLQNYWCDVSGLDWHPSDFLFRQYLKYLSPSGVERAIEIVAPKISNNFVVGDWSKYMWGVVHKLAEEGEDGT